MRLLFRLSQIGIDWDSFDHGAGLGTADGMFFWMNPCERRRDHIKSMSDCGLASFSKRAAQIQHIAAIRLSASHGVCGLFMQEQRRRGHAPNAIRRRPARLDRRA